MAGPTPQPFLRTFDAWAGHSWAGGFSSPGGKNQESSSEAIQSWGGLFLLGNVLGNTEMAAAGAMGMAVETAATREYRFDYHGWKDGPKAANFPPVYGRKVTGILFAAGNAYATYFTADPAWVYGIQWLPSSPFLSYLGDDPAFSRHHLDAMFADREQWLAKENAKRSSEGKPALAGGNTIGGMGTALGHVVLGYALQFNPAWVAGQCEDLWNADSPVVKENYTPGLTYFDAYARLSLGGLARGWHTSLPLSRVYQRVGAGNPEVVAYNPASTPVQAKVYRDGKQVGSITAPPNALVRTSEWTGK